MAEKIKYIIWWFENVIQKCSIIFASKQQTNIATNVTTTASTSELF